MSLVYTYIDLENIIREITEDQLNFAGNWDSTIQYFQDDVILFNDSRYIALTASTNSQPPVTAPRDNRWSVLVLVSTGTSVTGTNATDAFDLAFQAYQIAVYGTHVAEAAYGLAHYAIAIAGTGGGGGGDDSLARLALNTAWVGTNAANQAYNIAVSGLQTAWVGTLAGNQAYNVAMDAYRIAVDGTNKCDALIDSILTTIDGGIVVNSSGNVVTLGGP